MATAKTSIGCINIIAKREFKNLTVCTFDDVKYDNTTKATTITEIDDIHNINIDIVEL